MKKDTRKIFIDLDNQAVRNVYSVWTYDVWGNEVDGYIVNNRFKQFSNLVINDFENFEDKDLIDILIEQGLLKPDATPSDLVFMGDEYCYYIEDTEGCPLLELCLDD